MTAEIDHCRYIYLTICLLVQATATFYEINIALEEGNMTYIIKLINTKLQKEIQLYT